MNGDLEVMHNRASDFCTGTEHVVHIHSWKDSRYFRFQFRKRSLGQDQTKSGILTKDSRKGAPTPLLVEMKQYIF
jgi:hypothetical protein